MPPLFGLSLHKENKRLWSRTQHNQNLVHAGEKRQKRTNKEGVDKAGVVKQKGLRDSPNFLPSQAVAISKSQLISKTNSHGVEEVPESQ